jgi:hypothetical protein
MNNRPPIAWIDNLPGILTAMNIFTKIDLKSRYHKVLVDPQDIWKFVVEAKDGLYDS